MIIEIRELWCKHQRPRLHLGEIDGKPVLVTEYPEPPTFLIMSEMVFRDLRKECMDYNAMMTTKDGEFRFLNMRVAVIPSSYNASERIMEVK